MHHREKRKGQKFEMAKARLYADPPCAVEFVTVVARKELCNFPPPARSEWGSPSQVEFVFKVGMANAYKFLKCGSFRRYRLLLYPIIALFISKEWNAITLGRLLSR